MTLLEKMTKLLLSLGFTPKEISELSDFEIEYILKNQEPTL